MIVVLEGLDGAGKTTLAKTVAQAAGWSYVQRKSLATTTTFVQNVTQSLANALWASGDGRDFSAAFWLHLQAAWYLAMSEQTLPQAEAAGVPVLVDGWYYKFVSRLVVQGLDEKTLLDSFRDCRVPDLVVLLKVDPRVLWTRRSQFRPTELGLHRGYSQLGQDSFIDYQSEMATVMQSMAKTGGWAELDVEDSESVEETATRILDLCKWRLAKDYRV